MILFLSLPVPCAREEILLFFKVEKYVTTSQGSDIILLFFFFFEGEGLAVVEVDVVVGWRMRKV